VTKTQTVVRPRWLSKSRKFPSYGPGVLEWMRENLVHAEGDRFGEPFDPDPWFEDVVLRLYRVDPASMERVTRRALIGIAKGNAKTEYAAALAIAETAGPVMPWPGVLEGERGRLPSSPNVPLGAASYDQAGLCFGAAKVMIEQGPLGPFFDSFEKELRLKDRPGKVYRIAAEAGTQDGTLPTCFVADELHEWVGRKARVHLVVGNSLAKRQSGLEVNITTAGDPDTSELLRNLYDYGCKTATGEIDDPSFLMVWYEGDESLDLSDPDELRHGTRQANPAAFQDVERIVKRFEVDRIPEHEYRRYHLNQWATSGETWLPAGVFEGLADATVEVPDRTPIVAAFDGSYNGDSTTLFGCTLDGHVFEVGVWERPETVRDWKVPRNEVDARVDDMFRRFDVLELVCDPARWLLYMDEWIDRYGDDRVLEYPQSHTRMVPATAKFYDACTGGLLTHDGSPTLIRHVANSKVKELSGARYVLRKDHPNRKIDAAVTAVMAYDRATWRRDTTVDVNVEII